MSQRFTILDHLAPPGSLWRDGNFMCVFWATTLSVLGTAVTQMALPLTAIQMLHATASDMGVLAACRLLPFILGLPAGAWIDRSRKRRLAIIFDLFAAGGLLLVPLAYLAGVLSMPVLCLVAAMVSTTEAIGGSALQVFVTRLVGRERLVMANSRLSGASSAAMVAGPALAAALVAMAGAPLAILADAASFFVSALLLSRTRFDEIPGTRAGGHLLAEVKEGLVLVWRTPMLRALVGVVFVWITLEDSFKALYVLFASRELGLQAGDVALINTLGAVGGLLGAALAHPLERRLHIRRALPVGILIAACGYLLYVLPSAGGAYTAWAAGAALLIVDCGSAIYLVNYLSLRQRVTPDALLGRMVTSMRFLTILFAPFGTVLIGQAGDRFGLVATFVGIGVGCMLMGLAALRGLPGDQART
ncbi:MAG: MFS transporter [Rhodocyclaceae bacterium]